MEVRDKPCFRGAPSEELIPSLYVSEKRASEAHAVERKHTRDELPGEQLIPEEDTRRRWFRGRCGRAADRIEQLVSNPQFGLFMLLVTLINCIGLAVYDPVRATTAPPH